MNFSLLWQFFMMVMGAGTAMETLQPGQEIDLDDVGIPPAFITWRDGRKFTATISISRTA